MQVPYIDYSDNSLERLSSLVLSLLLSVGVVVIRNFPDTEDDYALLAFGNSLGELRRHFSLKKPSLSPPMTAEYVFVVESKPTGLRNFHGEVILSQTHLSFGCHTDEYFLREPSSIVTLLCCRPDELRGGHTLLAHVDDIVRVLPTESVRVLQMQSFPYADGATAILSFEANQWKIRYNRGYIDRNLKESGRRVGSDIIGALADLEVAVALVCNAIELAAGDCLVIHNHRMLHGRNGFHAFSSRKLKRLRVHKQKWPPHEMTERDRFKQTVDP